MQLNYTGARWGWAVDDCDVDAEYYGELEEKKLFVQYLILIIRFEMNYTTISIKFT